MSRFHKSYSRRISIRLLLAGFSVFVWMLIGSLLSLIGSVLIRYSLLGNAIAYGAMFGSLMGALVAVIALIVAWNTYSRRVMLWIIAGSIGGAIIGFVLALMLGGLGQGNQADLVLVSRLPMGVVIGTIVGSIVGGGMWRSRS